MKLEVIRAEDIRDGDVVVLKCGEDEMESVIARAGAAIEATGKDVMAVVLPHGTDIDVQQAEELMSNVATMKVMSDGLGEFYVLSLKWTKSDDGNLAIWWRQDAKGYTSNLVDAGRFTREEIEADPGYYDNGVDTIAVLAEHVEAGHYGEVVRALRYNSNVMGVAQDRMKMRKAADGQA